MLDDSCMLTVHGEGVAAAVTGEKRGYWSTGRTVGELVSRGGREIGDCDGAKTQPEEGLWFSSLFMKREQMVKMAVLVSRQRKRKATQGLLCLLGDRGRRGGKLGEEAVTASLGFGRATSFLQMSFFVFFL